MSEPTVPSKPRTLPAGDQALVVELGEGIDEQVNRRVHALDGALRRASLPGIVDLVPTYRSLLINYDPSRIGVRDIQSAVAALAESLDAGGLAQPRTIEVPTCYGAEFGPDLAFVAEHNHLTEDEVIRIHTSSVCRVFMMGFSPGFAYLGGMSPRIATPRLQTPRTSIPAGSVGIAQQQTGIYPVESPGGWQLIGRTPVQLFDPGHTPPTLVEPGDLIRFVAIDEERYREIEEIQRREKAAGDPRDDARAGARLPPGSRSSARRTAPARDPVVEVLDPGALTTVQDLGRYGFQRYGVPVSGAMDAFALRVANLLAGNEEDAAVLEMTVTGAQMVFLTSAVIAVAGADMQPRVDDRAAPMWEPFAVAKDAVLSFRSLRAGARAYLAIAGGIDVPSVLGSRSTYLRSRFGGMDGRALRPGDRLCRAPVADTVVARRMPSSWLPTYLGTHHLRVVLGPQDGAFTGRGVQTLLASAYVITAQSDRMGYRLEGPRIEHARGADIVSDGTPAGAVQVAGDGQPLVLLADRGTTGGYAKIATVVGADLPRLAQSRPGDRLFFDSVSVEEAHDALRRQEAVFEQIRRGPTAHIAAGQLSRAKAPSPSRTSGPARGSIVAPLPGRIVEVLVRAGDAVTRGQKVCVLEAMKMQNAVCATAGGRVAAVRVSAGDQVGHGETLIEIESRSE